MENKEDVVFKCPNDLQVIIKKDNGELVFDEKCCTNMMLVLKNNGEMATSFMGSHNEEILKVFGKAFKKYIKTLRKTLRKNNTDEEKIQVLSEDIPKENKWDESKELNEEKPDKLNKTKSKTNTSKVKPTTPKKSTSKDKNTRDNK